jgi:hypothetical protein
MTKFSDLSNTHQFCIRMGVFFMICLVILLYGKNKHDNCAKYWTIATADNYGNPAGDGAGLYISYKVNNQIYNRWTTIGKRSDVGKRYWVCFCVDDPTYIEVLEDSNVPSYIKAPPEGFAKCPF